MMRPALAFKSDKALHLFIDREKSILLCNPQNRQMFLEVLGPDCSRELRKKLRLPTRPVQTVRILFPRADQGRFQREKKKKRGKVPSKLPASPCRVLIRANYSGQGPRSTRFACEMQLAA